MKWPIPLILILTTLCLSQAKSPKVTSKQIKDIYQQLKALPFDENKIIPIHNWVLKKDRAVFTFKQGTFYLSQPIFGKITGAVFLGKGQFQMTPPNEIERYQVRRYLKKDSLNEEFTLAYLRFTDDTAEQLVRKFNPISGQVDRKAENFHRDISKWLLEDLGFNLHSEILTRLLNATMQPEFIAILKANKKKLNFSDYLIFNYDLEASEEVALYQYAPKSAKKSFYTLCSFDRQEEIMHGDGTDEEKDIIKITHYNLDLELKTNGKMQVKADIFYTTQRNDLNILSFKLFKKFQVDSVIASGEPLLFFKEKKEKRVTICLKQPTRAQLKDSLTVFYSGKGLESANGTFFLKDKITWYPRYGYLQPATYLLNFKIPRGWQVVAVGKEVERRRNDKYIFSRWQEEVPSMGAAFAFGKYEVSSFKLNDSFPIKVYSAKGRSEGRRKRICGDVANSFFIFQSLLGFYPYPQLNVVETHNLTSYGYPGVLFMTWLSFTRELEGVMEALRGHEVAHQWWGNLVGWKTYHDQWLSEGIAEYLGAVVAQFLLEGDRIFYQILDGWRTDLLDKGHIGVSIGLRRFGFSKRDLAQSEGLEAGPVWLGRRLGDRHPVDYYLITYQKGAYIFHMLRTIMRDYETGSDARFWNMLADFIKKYKGKRVSTADFQKVVEDHMGKDMDWFFREWVYGTEVPLYTYSYQISKNGQQYWIDLIVRQEKVSPQFKMYVPISVEFENGKKQSQLVLVDGVERSYHLGPYLQPPVKFIFNDFAGVLARVRSE